MNTKRLKSWSKEVWDWVYKARLIVMCVLFVAVALIFGCYIYPSEQSIKVSGFVLQFVGVVVAVHGLLKVRSHYGLKPLRKQAFEWWQQFPKWKMREITGECNIIGSDDVCKASGEQWIDDNPSEPLEKRLASVLSNMNRMRIVQKEHAGEIGSIRENNEKYQEEQRQVLRETEKEWRENLKSFHTNDIVYSLVGLVWLTAGMTMSTLPRELHEITLHTVA